MIYSSGDEDKKDWEFELFEEIWGVRTNDGLPSPENEVNEFRVAVVTTQNTPNPTATSSSRRARGRKWTTEEMMLCTTACIDVYLDAARGTGQRKDGSDGLKSPGIL